MRKPGKFRVIHGFKYRHITTGAEWTVVQIGDKRIFLRDQQDQEMSMTERQLRQHFRPSIIQFDTTQNTPGET